MDPWAALRTLSTLAVLVQPPSIPPVLELPERGLDDSAAYQGYRTRIVRDAAGDAVQLILDRRRGRVVVLWADSADESAAFTVRDSSGAPAAVRWGSPGVAVSPAAGAARAGATRSVTCRLSFAGGTIDIGHLALGSMRWERDLQYQNLDLAPWESPPPPIPELAELLDRLGRLDPAARERALRRLSALNLAELRARLRPGIASSRGDGVWTVQVSQRSFDGANHLALEFEASARACAVQVRDGRLRLEAQGPGPFVVDVRVRTDAAPLTPLARDRIFTAEFLAHCDRVEADTARAARSRRMERQVRGMELVSYEQKLLAGLPNFATYFGRDMLMTALMMEPLWRPEMLEHVVGVVLAKLSPAGEVSHEEALGGQAIRENAGEVNACLAAAEHAAGVARDSLLACASTLLGHLGRVRENYRMVDESLQLPVVAACYLAHPGIAPSAKRAFLVGTAARAPGGTPPEAARLAALLRNFDHVLAQATPYADAPDDPTRLVSFFEDPRGGWISGSWRDSGAGYAGGRFAMDVNVLWMPRALAAIEASLGRIEKLGIPADTLRAVAERAGDVTLARILREPGVLARVRERWDTSERWFEVRLSAAQVRARIAAWLAWLPEPERRLWAAAADTIPVPDTLRFLALALDSSGRAIPVMNTDPAGIVFLSDRDPARAAALLAPLLLDYPVGLLVPRLGPVVANDAYASPAVWAAFANDRYHSPRVVWGREVNLLELALAKQEPTPALRRDLDRVRAAVAASGLAYAELWSDSLEDGVLKTARFGSGSDVQLWSLTDLAVRYALDRDEEAP